MMSEQAEIVAAPAGRLDLVGADILRWAGLALMAMVWISSAIFGLYILAFYGGAFRAGDMGRWNQVLPGLYEPGRPLAAAAIGAHFVAGGIILALGFVQLISAIRDRAPALHRWIGRLYVSASLVAGLGGLAFIASEGTVGGAPMNIGFSMYGILMVAAAIQTWRNASRRRFDAHRAWAIRLFALAIGSWLYRMYYGIWFAVAGTTWHTRDFRGPFDVVMVFFFFIPNLIVADLFIRARRSNAHPALKLAAAAIMAGATGLLLISTYYMTRLHWGPAILAELRG